MTKPTWITPRDLSRLAGGLTKEKLRSIRRNYPELVKPKTKDTRSYLYNWTELKNIYAA
jgi:hypothetical protein